jgi:hypothetical protein
MLPSLQIPFRQLVGFRKIYRKPVLGGRINIVKLLVIIHVDRVSGFGKAVLRDVKIRTIPGGCLIKSESYYIYIVVLYIYYCIIYIYLFIYYIILYDMILYYIIYIYR